MKCAHCQHESGTDFPFCPVCGASQSSPTPTRVPPPPPPNAYPQPGPSGYPQHGYPQQPQAGTNGMAIASMVMGILWLYWVGSALALVFGYMARKQIRESGGQQQGNGMATAGIVLGWIGVAVLIVLVALFIVAAVAGSSSGR